MFTGIVEEMGTLLEIEASALVIQAKDVLQDIAVKDSIAVDGTCLTVTDLGPDWFRVDTMPETLRRTRLGSLQPGDLLNLERAMASGGRMGGHMVQGHIEATAPVLTLRPDGIGLDVEIALPEQLAPYIIAKGFITINGTSLTVVERHSDRFSVSLIPYTRQHTNLGHLREGMLLNLETDIVGRYVVQLMQQYRPVSLAK
jgi:riboflavin synthase